MKSAKTWWNYSGSFFVICKKIEELVYLSHGYRNTDISKHNRNTTKKKAHCLDRPVVGRQLSHIMNKHRRHNNYIPHEKTSRSIIYPSQQNDCPANAIQSARNCTTVSFRHKCREWRVHDIDLYIDISKSKIIRLIHKKPILLIAFCFGQSYPVYVMY